MCNDLADAVLDGHHCALLHHDLLVHPDDAKRQLEGEPGVSVGVRQLLLNHLLFNFQGHHQNPSSFQQRGNNSTHNFAFEGDV